MFQFILKVMSASAVISVAIKYLGPTLEIPVSSAIALTMVLLPPIALGGFLVWRSVNSSPTPQPLNLQRSASGNPEKKTHGN